MVAELAAAKGFTVEQLVAFGVRQGSRGVEIPYFDAQGAEKKRIRYRTAVSAREGSAWSEGTESLVPYGLNRPIPWEKHYAFIVEGETDCWALWTAGKPALGVPGASNAKCLHAEHVEGATSLYVVREPGVAGARFPHKVADRLYGQGFEGTIFAIDLEKAKDPHELWVLDPVNFEADLRAAMQSREPLKRQIVDKADTGMRSLASILAKPRRKTQFLVDGLLPDGGIMLAVGKPKAGKSELVRNLARSVALGVPFLDRDVRQGNVAWVRLEEPFDHFIDNVLAMGGEQFVEQLFVNESSPPADTMKWIDDIVRDLKPKLIVIDTWAKLTRVDDINSYSKVNLANESLMRIARDRGIAQVWIHHSNKGEGKGGAAVLGSSALFAACDTLLFVDQLPNDIRTVSTTQRVGEGMPETQIAMDLDTKIITIATGKSGIRNGQIEQQILEIISSEPSTLKSDIIDRITARKTDVLAALVALEERGMIVNDSAGVKGDPHRYSVVLRNHRNVIPVNFGNGIDPSRERNDALPGTESRNSGTESGPSGNRIGLIREHNSHSVPGDRENQPSATRDSFPFPATTPPYGGECGGDGGTQSLLVPEPVRTHDGVRLDSVSPILVSPTQPVPADVSRQTPAAGIANGGRA